MAVEELQQARGETPSERCGEIGKDGTFVVPGLEALNGGDLDRMGRIDRMELRALECTRIGLMKQRLLRFGVI